MVSERLAKCPASLVLALCAAWCDTCRGFRPVFERLAAERRDWLFLWLDVEDDEEIIGGIDIDRFSLSGGFPIRIADLLRRR